MSKKTNFWLFFLFILTIFSLDRLTKILFTKESCAFIFCIKPSINPGAVFGIFPGATAVLIVIAFAVLFVAALLLRTKEVKESSLMQISLLLIIAGVLGNLFDRLAYGYVIDWLTFSFFKQSFNLADAANFLGVILILVKLLKKKR